MRKGQLNTLSKILILAILIAAVILGTTGFTNQLSKQFCQNDFYDFMQKLESNACILQPGDQPQKKEMDLLNRFKCVDHIVYDELNQEIKYKFKDEQDEKSRDVRCCSGISKNKCLYSIQYYGFRRENQPLVSKKTQESLNEKRPFRIEVRSGQIVLDSEKTFMLKNISRIINCVYDSCVFELLEDSNFPTPDSCKELEIKGIPCYKKGAKNYIENTPTTNVIMRVIGSAEQIDSFALGIKGIVAEQCGKKVPSMSRNLYISPSIANPTLNVNNQLSCRILDTDTERNYCCTDVGKVPVRNSESLDCNLAAGKSFKFFAKDDGKPVQRGVTPNVGVFVCEADEEVVN